VVRIPERLAGFGREFGRGEADRRWREREEGVHHGSNARTVHVDAADADRGEAPWLGEVFQEGDSFLSIDGVPPNAVALQTHSRREPMIEAARTVKHHWHGILCRSASQISNGVLETINSLVQAARARARSYHSTHNFITMVYLFSRRLQLELPT
jgi:hypothetical protein